MIPSATGESRKQSGLMNQQMAMKQGGPKEPRAISPSVLATSLWRAARARVCVDQFPNRPAEFKRHRRGPGEDHRQQNQQGKRPVRKDRGQPPASIQPQMEGRR